MRTLCLLLLLTFSTTLLAAPEAVIPEARQVVVRRSPSLQDALVAALGRPDEAALARGALVVDVTPYTREHAETLATALRALDEDPRMPRPWRIAALGRPFVRGTWSPGELSFRLPEVLAEDTNVGSTIDALRASLRTLQERGGTLIYLADWHFEDEHGLERLIGDLEAKRIAFGVVGSEAAFGRGWNDGVLGMQDLMRNGRLELKDPAEQKRYDDAIGRDPFGPIREDAPWHGGDTAWPHLPYRFSGRYWETTFSPSSLRFAKGGLGDLPPDATLEDLLERLGRERETFSSTSFRKTALPSAYGPYGLMRAAAERGGRYVLWSWNPEHRASLEYDYARCNLFGPDLRSRTDIRKDVTRRPLARALLAAWHDVGSKFNALAEHTPPLDKSGRRPQPIDLLERPAATLHTIWMDRNVHREFLRKAKHWRDAAAAGGKRLTKALDAVKEPLDAPDRRYQADALLFRHILQVLHFELSEAIAAAESVPEEAFEDEDTSPGIRPVVWIERGDDPASIRTSDAHVFDPALGEEVRAARAVHLRRFRGTPFGVQVAANSVETWVVTSAQKMKPSTGDLHPDGRTPGESEGEPPEPSPGPPATGPGSSGGGPSTGGR